MRHLSEALGTTTFLVIASPGFYLAILAAHNLHIEMYKYVFIMFFLMQLSWKDFGPLVVHYTVGSGKDKTELLKVVNKIIIFNSMFLSTYVCCLMHFYFFYILFKLNVI